MTTTAIRKGAWLQSGTLSPNPWDLTLSDQNVWSRLEDTRGEDKVPQGCDPTATSRAGLAWGGSDAGVVPNSTQTVSERKLIAAKKMGLTNGFALAYRSLRL